MDTAAIKTWAADVRAGTSGGFQINLWIPDPPPQRDADAEAAVRSFLSKWSPPIAADAGDGKPPDFDSQCEAVLEVKPQVISSIMGVYPPAFVEKLKVRGIKWFACATTVREAKRAEDAGADAIVAQGMEAGGHRGAFDAAKAESEMVGLFCLLPAVADAVKVPVIATGGVSDSRGIAAALILGASAVQIGTGFLRSPEANIPRGWADSIGRTLPEETLLTRAFSGRPGRAIANAYLRAATAPGAPNPAPYPVQRGLTKAMRELAARSNDKDRIQGWMGQSAALAKALPAGEIAKHLWEDAQKLLR